MSKAKGGSGNIEAYHKKNSDNLKLLFSHPEIERVVAEARTFLKIPEGGFLNPEFPADDDEIQIWNTQTIKLSNRLRGLKKMREQIDRIKEKVSENTLTESAAQEQIRLLYEKLPENYLTKVVTEIMLENRLPANYADSIRSYIIAGTISTPGLPFSILSEPADKSNTPKFPSFKFHVQPTDTDIELVKKLAKSNMFGLKLPENPAAIKNIDKKLKMEKMRKTKKVLDPTEQKSYKLTAKDISETVNQEFPKTPRTKPQQVYDATRELKALRKKRFGK